MFIHTDKDLITVGAYHATLADFLTLEPSYSLPDGGLWQLYVPGDKHLVSYGLYQRDEGTVWTDGDAYLALESYYSGIQPDTTPDVPGFLDDLINIFGDYITLNSLYAGWPLFQQTLLEENWTAADDLLTDSYVNYQITTETYTAIVSSAQAHYLPMRLQGRPGLLPLNLTDVITLVAVVTPSSPQTDTGDLTATDAAEVNLIGITLPEDSAVVEAVEAVLNVMPLEPVTTTDDATVDMTEVAEVAFSALLVDDAAGAFLEDGSAPTLDPPILPIPATDSLAVDLAEETYDGLALLTMGEDLANLLNDDAAPGVEATDP
jgi:hypothetical protein